MRVVQVPQMPERQAKAGASPSPSANSSSVPLSRVHSASTPDLAKRTCTGPASDASDAAAGGASLAASGATGFSTAGAAGDTSWPFALGAAAAAGVFGTVAAPKDS